MKNIKKIIKNRIKIFVYLILFYSGLLDVFLAFYKKSNKGHSAIILFYHRFQKGGKPTLPDRLNIKSFDRHLSYIKKRYEVITLDECVQTLKNRTDFSKPSVVITIDDGFKDNYLYAFPILKKYGLRATFFLTTGYIGSDTLFAWMGLDKGGKEDLVRNRERWAPLSWEEIKEMKEYGMEFGTHTHTHKNSLSRLDIQETKEEIETSTKLFKEKIGCDPELFSYPHGTFKDYNASHIDLLKAYNYRAALTTNIGRNNQFQNPYELKRIIIYEEDSFWEFKKKMKGAYDFAGYLQKIWLRVVGTK